jgi:hypothetical protein
MTMPTMEQLDKACAAIMACNFELAESIEPVFAAARRGVESSDDSILGKLLEWKERAERAEAAIVKLVGAIDMIRETIHGGNVQDLLLIINNALDEARNV